jgi:hypothetical protein
VTARTVDPQVRLLGTLVRMRDSKTIRRVISVLDKHDGTVVKAAAELGTRARRPPAPP